MRTINFGDTDIQAELGDVVNLQSLTNLEVVSCQESGKLMLNIDAYQIQPGDLNFIKSLGLTISNPDTDLPVALGVDYIEDTWGSEINDFLESEDESYDDSSFFDVAGLFLGGIGNAGFSGGFGGFGGGIFSGGGASSSF